MMRSKAGRGARRPVRALLLGAACVALLVGCSDSPEEMLESARHYIERNDYNAASIQLRNALQEDGQMAEARYLLGMVYLRQGEISGAIRELQRAEDMGVEPERVAPHLARALLLSGEPGQVVEKYGDVELDDDKAQALTKIVLGDAYLAQGNTSAASEAFSEAHELAPTEVGALVGLGQVQHAEQNYNEALEMAERAIALQADYADAWVLKADVYRTRNDTSAARDALMTAVANQPSSIDPYFALISMLLAEGELETAEKHLADLSEIAPRHPATRYLKAFVDTQHDRLESARDHVEDVLEQAPDNLPARLLAGEVHYRLGNHERAQRHLTQLLRQAPHQPHAMRLKAASLLASGEPNSAREIIEPMLAADVQDQATLALAGEIYLATGDFARASEYLMRVASYDPEDSRARMRLGVSRLAEGDSERAFADLEAASALDRDSGRSEITMILAHLRERKFDEALAVHERLQEKEPDNPVTYILEGGIRMGQMDWFRAREAFEKALEIEPHNITAATNLSRLDMMEGEPEQAMQRFESVIEARPESTDAYLLLAEIKRQNDASAEEVQAVLQRAIDANRGAAAPQLAMARFHLGQNQPGRALSIARDVVAANPNDAAAVETLARAQIASGQHRQGIASLNRLISLMPQAPLPLLQLAEVQQHVGEQNEAVRSLRRALSLRPDLLQAQQRLMTLLVQQQNFEAALDVAREVQRQRPDAAMGYEFEGDIRANAGEHDQAVEAFKQAMEREPSVSLAIKLHSLQSRLGESQAAEETQAAWLDSSPEDTRFRSYMAERAMSSGDMEDAEMYYRRIVEIEPDNALVLNNLAWVAGQLERDDAVELAERAVELAPESAPVLDTLGMLQVAQGMHEKGLANLEKAVELSPQAPVLRLNLIRGYQAAGRTEDAQREIDTLIAQVPEDSDTYREAMRLGEQL